MNIINKFDLSLCTYLVNLSNGLNSAEDRELLKQAVGTDEDRFCIVVDSLFSIISRPEMRDRLTITQIQDLVQDEYNQLGFNTTFFDYSYIYPFLNLLLKRDEIMGEAGASRDVVYSTFYEAARSLPMERLRNGMYVTILNSIVKYRLVSAMMDATADITDTLKGVDPDTMLSLGAFEQNF